MVFYSCHFDFFTIISCCEVADKSRADLFKTSDCSNCVKTVLLATEIIGPLTTLLLAHVFGISI